MESTTDPIEHSATRTALPIPFGGTVSAHATFTFSPPPLESPLSFAHTLPARDAPRSALKRRRAPPVPYPRKKRRLRLRFCTSRLSPPFTCPPTYIVDRGSCRVAVLAKTAAAAAERQWEIQRVWDATSKSAGMGPARMSWNAGSAGPSGQGPPGLAGWERSQSGVVAKRPRPGGLGRFACLNLRRQKRCGSFSVLASPGALLECRNVMNLRAPRGVEDQAVMDTAVGDPLSYSDMSDTTTSSATALSTEPMPLDPGGNTSPTASGNPNINPNFSPLPTPSITSPNLSYIDPTTAHPNPSFLPPTPLSSYDALDDDPDLPPDPDDDDHLTPTNPFSALLSDPDDDLPGADLWPTRPASRASTTTPASSPAASATTSPDLVARSHAPLTPLTQPSSLGLAARPADAPLAFPPLPTPALPVEAARVGANPNLRFLAELGLLDGWEAVELGASGVDPDRGEGEVMRLRMGMGVGAGWCGLA